MKNIIILTAILVSIFTFCQKNSLPPIQESCPQKIIVPLRTYKYIPENQCYYRKDINNELNDYEGTWVGNWNNKTIHITFKKIMKFNDFNKYYKDLLIARFKVVSTNGSILFDNTALSDNNTKINNGGFYKDENKVGLSYYDKDICNTSGRIIISFTDFNKTQLKWAYSANSQLIFPNCQYHSSGIPEVLPKGIVLTKQ